MNVHDPQWWKDSRWHRGLAELVEAQEPRRLAHRLGTPRHPRTAAAAARKYHGKGVFVAGVVPEAGMAGLLAAGYYDGYRKAFDHADD